MSPDQGTRSAPENVKWLLVIFITNHFSYFVGITGGSQFPKACASHLVDHWNFNCIVTTTDKARITAAFVPKLYNSYEWNRVIWSSVTTKKLCKKNFYQSIFLYRDTATKTLKLLQHYVHHISQCPRFQKTTKWKNIHHCSCNSSIVEEGFFWLLLTKQDCINLCLFPMFFTLFWSTQPTPSYMGEKIKLCKWMTGITGRSTSCLLLHQSLLKYRKHKFWSLLMWALYIHINCTRIFKKK